MSSVVKKISNISIKEDKYNERLGITSSSLSHPSLPLSSILQLSLSLSASLGSSSLILFFLIFIFIIFIDILFISVITRAYNCTPNARFGVCVREMGREGEKIGCKRGTYFNISIQQLTWMANYMFLEVTKITRMSLQTPLSFGVAMLVCLHHIISYISFYVLIYLFDHYMISSKLLYYFVMFLVYFMC